MTASTTQLVVAADMATPRQECCDEAKWKLGSNGLPLDPAVPCPVHRKKPGTTKSADPAAPADAPDLRDGNKNKFAWFYEMLGDPTVSLAAKVVGTGCVMKMAGRKGHFKATRKAIANLCGCSQSTVRRGLADLIAKKFLHDDTHEGAASTYYLILPAQRWEMWFHEESEYERDTAHAQREMKRWLFAEKLHTKNQFRDAIYEASLARGADQDRARRISDWLVGKFGERDLDLDIANGLAWVAASKPAVFVPDDERADPGTPESRPLSAREPTPVRLRADPGTPESRPRLTPDALTSAKDETHKSFKDSERPVKVFQDLESEPALRDALNARPPHGSADAPAERNAGPCALCDRDGIFLDRYGSPVVLFDDDDREHPVECQHSIVANLADIQRREKAEGLALGKTGWLEIDCHYPLFDDGDSDDF